MAILWTTALIALVIFVYLYEKTVKPKNYPPGPKWNPLTGSLPAVRKLAKEHGGLHKALHHLSEIYNSNTIGLKNGSRKVVAVVTSDLVKEVLRRDEFQARPTTFFSTVRSFGTNKGITFVNGEPWNTQRNFLIRHLRYVGFGKQRMDQMIADELVNIINCLGMNESQQIGRVISPSVLNILWALVAGERIVNDNSRLQNLLNLMASRSRVFDLAGGWLETWPWLRFIAPKKLGYDIILKINNDLKAILINIIGEHKKLWHPGRNDDVIYAFLSEMHEENDGSFTDDQLVMILVDVFFGGATTTSNTLDFAFMCMIMYPDIQKKVHKEIDAAYSNCTMPSYKDRQLLPYVEAVICEVMRCYHVTPITGPRLTLTDTTLDSYFVPKGTVLLMSNYSVNHDPKLWKDPDVFRPERFLNQSGEVEVPSYYHPFNVGKRKCLADALARNCVFTFFAGVMRTYEITLHEKSQPLTGVPIPGLTISPEQYTARFTKRE